MTGKFLVALLLLVFCCAHAARAKLTFENLSSWTGKYPTERKGKITTSFFSQAELKQPLMRLLSARNYKLLTQEYQVEVPIKHLGDFLIAKDCRPHNCGSDNAACAIDLRDGSIYVMMRESDREQWFSKRKTTDLPSDVRTFMSDFSAD